MPADEDFPSAADMIRQIELPTGFIYGELSRFFQGDAPAALASLIAPRLIRSLPDAYHHVFLDQPLAFIDVLRTLLTDLQTGAQ